MWCLYYSAHVRQEFQLTIRTQLLYTISIVREMARPLSMTLVPLLRSLLIMYCSIYVVWIPMLTVTFFLTLVVLSFRSLYRYKTQTVGPVVNFWMRWCGSGLVYSQEVANFLEESGVKLLALVRMNCIWSSISADSFIDKDLATVVAS